MPNVLIVDDSPTAREVLAAILSTDPDLNVVGFAENGSEAMEKVQELHPDVVTMDINMPVMNGLQATQQIMIEAPTPIVIISASSRAQEVETTMQAFRYGALTLLQKPSGPRDPQFATLSKEIVDTVKAMSGVLVIRRRRRLTSKKSDASCVREVPRSVPRSSLRAVAIVASTGGPPALAKLLGDLPCDFPVPVFLVQHIVPSFVSGFATWLDSVTELHVKLAENDELAVSGTVYVAPPDRHLGVTRGLRIRLSDDPAIEGFRPAGTHLLASLASACGKDAAGVIMTGMGQDGVKGMEALHSVGANTIAQDEASCVVYGMPRVAIEQSLISKVLPLEGIAKHLLQLASVKRAPSGSDGVEEQD